jgi:hypothetical protein
MYRQGMMGQEASSLKKASHNLLKRLKATLSTNRVKASAFTKVVQGWTVKVDTAKWRDAMAKVTFTKGKQVITGDMFLDPQDPWGGADGVEWDYENVPPALEKIAVDVTNQALAVLSPHNAKAAVSAARPSKKANSKRINDAFNEVGFGVQINMMDISKVFKVGEQAIAQGADDAALEKAIADFLQTIRLN